MLRAGWMAAGVAGALLLAQTGRAAEPSESEQRAACTGDVFRYCMAHIPSRARISECMIANRSQLSPACRAMIDITLASRRTARE